MWCLCGLTSKFSGWMQAQLADSPLERSVGGHVSHEMTSEIIWSLVAINAAIVATIAAHFAQRACSKAATDCELAISKARAAIELASLAIDRVSSSRVSRLAAEDADRSSSLRRSHS